VTNLSHLHSFVLSFFKHLFPSSHLLKWSSPFKAHFKCYLFHEICPDISSYARALPN
jgi:hypothetical protein